MASNAVIALGRKEGRENGGGMGNTKTLFYVRIDGNRNNQSTVPPSPFSSEYRRYPPPRVVLALITTLIEMFLWSAELYFYGPLKALTLYSDSYSQISF